MIAHNHSDLIRLKSHICWLGKNSLVNVVEGRFYSIKKFKKEVNSGSKMLSLSALLQEMESCKKVLIVCRLYLWWPLRNKSAVIPHAKFQIAGSLPQLTHTALLMLLFISLLTRKRSNERIPSTFSAGQMKETVSWKGNHVKV